MRLDSSEAERKLHPAVPDRQEQQLWHQARATGMSRRTFLARLGAGGAAAVLAACEGAPEPTPTVNPGAFQHRSCPSATATS